MGILALFARPVTIAGVTVQHFSRPSTTRARFGSTGPRCSRRGSSVAHPFGTDGSARDVLSRVLYGGRFAVSSGFIAVGIGAAIGLVSAPSPATTAAGSTTVIMRTLDAAFAFPVLVLALDHRRCARLSERELVHRVHRMSAGPARPRRGALHPRGGVREGREGARRERRTDGAQTRPPERRRTACRPGLLSIGTVARCGGTGSSGWASARVSRVGDGAGL